MNIVLHARVEFIVRGRVRVKVGSLQRWVCVCALQAPQGICRVCDQVNASLVVDLSNAASLVVDLITAASLMVDLSNAASLVVDLSNAASLVAGVCGCRRGRPTGLEELQAA